MVLFFRRFCYLVSVSNKIEHKAIEEDHVRLDQYLTKHRLATSRSEALKWIKDGFVLVNQKKEKPSYKIQLDDVIVIHKPSIKILDLKPVDLNLDVVFEDDSLIVVNKPAGLVVHPGAGNYDLSLVHGLLHHCKKGLSGIGGVERPGIVHRLDKGTSGLIVVAKTDKAHKSLSEQFQSRDIYKEYRAITLGSIRREEQTLDNLVKRSEFNRKKFVVNQKKGKQAITHLKVLDKKKKASYVSVKIDTGRTHQIRVHLSFIGHPIMGDVTYGGTKKLSAYSRDEQEFIKGLGRPLLHSHKLIFKHPKTKKEISLACNEPQEFELAKNIFLKSL